MLDPGVDDKVARIVVELACEGTGITAVKIVVEVGIVLVTPPNDVEIVTTVVLENVGTGTTTVCDAEDADPEREIELI
jgi:hypothetical protein